MIFDNDNSMIVANITGPDLHNWQNKIFSSSSNNMLIEFRSDAAYEYIGFSASIHYLPKPSKECEIGLDMKEKTIQSPNYPNSYDNKFSCHWLITVQYGFHIILRFLELNVSILTILTIQYILTH